MSIRTKISNGLLGERTMPVVPSSYNRNEAGFWMFGENGVDRFFSYSGHQSPVTAYTNCPPLAAIINRKAQAYINGKVRVVNTRGKDATGFNTNLKRLLKKPNPLQSWKQFEAQAYVYQQLWGFNMLLSIKPSGFTKNIDASSIWNIPPFMLDIEETDKLFYQTSLKGMIKSIKLSYKNNEPSYLKIEDVYIMNDLVPSFSNMIFSESRIKAQEAPINNIIGAYDCRNTLINYRGAQGFLSPDKDPVGTIPLDPGQKEQLQKDFMRYGLKKGQYQIIISNTLLRWQEMGRSTKELMLFEEVEESSKALCDAFNYPPHLLGLLDPTFNNRNAAEKDLYQNSIGSDADSNYEQWNDFFGLADENLRIIKDFSHLPILQNDKKSAADALLSQNNALKVLWRNGMLTLNGWLKKVGEDPIEGDTDGRFDMYFPEYVAKFGDPDKPVATPSTDNQNSNDGQQQGQQQPGK